MDGQCLLTALMECLLPESGAKFQACFIIFIETSFGSLSQQAKSCFQEIVLDLGFKREDVRSGL